MNNNGVGMSSLMKLIIMSIVVIVILIFIGAFFPAVAGILQVIGIDSGDDSDDTVYSVNLLRDAYEGCFDQAESSSKGSCYCDSNVNLEFESLESYVDITSYSSLAEGVGLKFVSNRKTDKIEEKTQRFCFLENPSRDINDSSCGYRVNHEIDPTSYFFVYSETWKVRSNTGEYSEVSSCVNTALGLDWVKSLCGNLEGKNYIQGLDILSDHVSNGIDNINTLTMHRNDVENLVFNEGNIFNGNILDVSCSGFYKDGTFKILKDEDEASFEYQDVEFENILIDKEPIKIYMVKDQGFIYGCLVPKDKSSDLELCEG